MAINYNLSKVYAVSDNDKEFATQIAVLFTEEVPVEIKNIKEGLKEKDYDRVYHAAHKIKPTLDLLGMDIAYEDVLTIEKWSIAKGKKKEIKDVVVSLKERVELTLKELKKDFSI